MLIRLLAIGNKMPAWVEAGIEDYLKRFPSSCQLQIVALPLEKRTKQSHLPALITKESAKLLAATKPQHELIALAVQGEVWSTLDLAHKIKHGQMTGKNIDFIIGGPDGLSPELLKKASKHWSISGLTLPHPLVRIILVEQIYRALMILQNHPYHRD